MKRKDLNYIAIEMLERCGNSEPTERQITIMEKLLSNISMFQYMAFHHELTESEVNCLYLAAKGYSIQETANFLKEDSTTIEFHRKQILHKLGCKNITQAVFEGIRYGALPSHLSGISKPLHLQK